MKKVRFVEPMSQPHGVYNRYVRQSPLIGPLLLATLLERQGHDVAIYNENLTGSVLNDPDVLADLCDADYVGISIMTPTASRGYRLASAIRERSARPRVMIGGVHATFQPQEALRYADFVVTGEGENVVAEIVEGRAAPGIVRGSPVEDMDALPLPDYDLIHGFARNWASPLAGNNMPDGYLDGDIARALDATSQQWREALTRLPRVPGCAEREIAALCEQMRRRQVAMGRPHVTA